MTGNTTVPAIDANGTDVYVSSSSNQLGSNPSHAFQLFRFAASTGAGTQMTTATDGIGSDRFVVSVSGDDQWIAFISRDNPTGQNPDRSGEVFVVQHDGTGLQQITNHPGAGQGDALLLAMAGNGTKVAFTSNGNLTGSNSGHVQQVFLVNRDGTGLTQVTHLADGEIYFLKISDDATKIVFGAEADPLGTNADGNVEIFAINANGTGLRQLTTTLDFAYSPAVQWVSFAGGGSKVAFSGSADPFGTNADHGPEVFVVDYAGTNLKQLTTSVGPAALQRESDSPAITGDGTTVYFTSNQFTASVNRDGSFELWKINSDGTGKTLLTNNGISYFNLVISSSGNRLAFQDSYGSGEVEVIDATGINLRSLTSTTYDASESATIDGAGDRVAFESTGDLISGSNTGHTREVFTAHSDGSALVQLTQGLNVFTPVLAKNGGTIDFGSSADPLGTNPGHFGQVFQINPDGTGLKQVTSAPSGLAYLLAVSRDGSVIVFTSVGNLTGQNADASYELYRINADGTGLIQLTTSSDGQSFSGDSSIDDAGGWVAFDGNANLDGSHPNGVYDIWRIHSDGSGLQAITTGVAGDTSYQPDISGDGTTICFQSNKNLTGGNAGHRDQIFLWTGGIFRQVTSFSDGYSSSCNLSRNGQWAYFESSASVFDPNPSGVLQLYRFNLSTSALERVDGLGFGPPYNSPGQHSGGYNGAGVDDTGVHVVYEQSTDGVRTNPDFNPEIISYDYTHAPTITVSSGPAPTHVSWDFEAGPVRYDVVRGDVASLRINGSSVDLGTVACVKNDSAVNSTEGSDDGLTPAPGHVFFYVYRGSQGLGAGPGSYGTGSGGNARVASSGDCAP